MRYKIDNIVSDLAINEKYFLKLIRDIGLENHMYLSLSDLKIIFERMVVKTWKTEQVLEKIALLIEESDKDYKTF